VSDHDDRCGERERRDRQPWRRGAARDASSGALAMPTAANPSQKSGSVASPPGRMPMLDACHTAMLARMPPVAMPTAATGERRAAAANGASKGHAR